MPSLAHLTGSSCASSWHCFFGSLNRLQQYQCRQVDITKHIYAENILIILNQQTYIFVIDKQRVCQNSLILKIGQEVNVIHKRHLPSTFTFTDLPHHRTCGSAYGGFVLSHLTMCGKLFSAIPSRYVTSILLSDSVLSCEQRVPFRTSDYKRLSRQQSFTVALHDSVLPYRQPVSWVL